MVDIFSGSYAPDDVEFLLSPQDLTTLSVAEKERKLQEGTHYSDLLSAEQAPAAQYREFFESQLRRVKKKMARDILRLARAVYGKVNADRPVAVVSLARAGTPVGVLLKRTLEAAPFNFLVKHYSVSILRDKGLDLEALSYITQLHIDQNIVFVDGWTGKGVITQELHKSVTAFNAATGRSISPCLHVLTDIAHVAGFSASREDYLIPSAILNATVSGLISRTLSPSEGAKGFHRCALQQHLRAFDRSTYFVDTVYRQIEEKLQACKAGRSVAVDFDDSYIVQKGTISALVPTLMYRYGVPHQNYVKPGVCESTRVLLRRVPKMLLVRDLQDPEVAHLLYLAKKKTTVIQDPRLPCRAVALIKQID